MRLIGSYHPKCFTCIIQFHIQAAANVGLQLFVWKMIQLINNNTRINSVFYAHWKLTFAPPCICYIDIIMFNNSFLPFIVSMFLHYFRCSFSFTIYPPILSSSSTHPPSLCKHHTVVPVLEFFLFFLFCFIPPLLPQAPQSCQPALYI